jgi:antitoxin component of MazEF toxin-antitoxin module
MDGKVITKLGSPATLVLTPEMMAELGISGEDEVEIALINRKLILRSLKEARREERMREIKKELFAERHSAYQRLAEGVK